jgi:hypothetical protein
VVFNHVLHYQLNLGLLASQTGDYTDRDRIPNRPMRSEDAVGLINGPRRDLACSGRKFSVIVGHPQQISRFDVQLRQ